VPDLTVTLGAKRDAELGRTQAVMGVSIPLPLMDRQQAQVTQALRREDQAREQWVAASVRLQLEVSQAAEKLGLAREQVLLLRREVLPAAQSAVDVAMKGYELGKFAFIDVLDAQRTLSQLRQQAVRHTADAFRAAAELERLLGHPADAQRVSTE
jgi:cobalt-zinc-cadmium efflux system outer membrane protein